MSGDTPNARCVECGSRNIANNGACGSDDCCGPNYDYCVDCGSDEIEAAVERDDLRHEWIDGRDDYVCRHCEQNAQGTNFSKPCAGTK